MASTGGVSASTLAGKTVRLSWSSGPTSGTTQEHVFHEDGTVEWHALPRKAAASKAPERPKYFASDVGSDGVLISYLSESGYTLTVARDSGSGKVVGVASNAKDWMPVSGSFTLN